MSLVVENGTGLPDAEAYASVAQFRTRCGKLGRDVTSVSDDDAEVALRLGAIYMLANYRMAWQGYRVNDIQSLDWPRYQVVRIDAIGGYGGYANFYPFDSVPVEIQEANIDLAWRQSQAIELMPDIDRLEKMVKVGPISVEYDLNSTPLVTFSEVENKLSSFLTASGGGLSVMLLRT